MSDLLTRGVQDVVPRELAEQKLASQKPIRLYLGIDPTGARLHIGHSVSLRKLKAFTEAGHEVIFLIGSFTAMIGDPTGRDALRESLTKKEVEANLTDYKKQASKILDFSKVEIRYNHEWLEKLTFGDIINLAGNFTVQQMLERDMFANRMKEGKPIHLHEFFYPLMQGYDSAVMDVDLEVGGNDQLFNILAGRTLQAAAGGREKFALTTKLINGTDGRKMSKSYNNCIFLDDEPSDMFGKVMSANDDVMESYFECCTDVPMDEIAEILQGNPRDAKVRLAKEIVTLYHSTEAADAAESEFNTVFKEGGIPDDIPEVSVQKGSVLIDVLVDHNIIGSKSEARRLVEQGGIKKDDSVIDAIDAQAEEGIYRVGKRKFIKIVCN